MLKLHKEQAPRQAVFNHEPCDDCKKLMDRGTMIIKCKDGEKGENPYRTGRQWVIKNEAAKRMGINSKVAYISETDARKIGFDA